MGRLDGKVAVVTGAGSVGPGWGNGRAAATAFAREGAAVVLFDTNAAAVKETAAYIESEGGRAIVSVGDVSDATDVAKLFGDAIDAFGGVDILHNNVGIYFAGGPVETSEADWDRMMAINVKGAFLTCKYAIPLMENGSGGSIINVGSISGVRALADPTLAYATSKGAILAFTTAIAAQYGPSDIRANVIVPGVIDSPLLRSHLAARANTGEYGPKRSVTIPLGRLGTGWDVAAAAVFLASDEAAYITGTQIVVDGGLLCKGP